MVLKIERFQPEGMNIRMAAGQPSYSHVVTVSGTGRLVYTAGQLARDIDGNCVGKGDMRAQMEQVFANLGSVFEGGGCDLVGRGEDQHVRHRFRRVPEMRRCAHALFRRRDADQHDRRRDAPRGPGFHGRDPSGRCSQRVR